VRTGQPDLHHWSIREEPAPEGRAGPRQHDRHIADSHWPRTPQAIKLSPSGTDEKTTSDRS
jgi:hypothetical protein